MNVPDLFAALEGGSQRQRLEAARVLARRATHKDLPALDRALNQEKLPWIRTALEAAVARASAALASEQNNYDPIPIADEDALAREIYSRATEELTGRFVHELRPLLGQARVWASREISGYEASQTAGLLSKMQDLLRAIDTLGQAAASARSIEFDLAALVQDTATDCTEEFGEANSRFQLTGPEPMVTVSDPDLLKLALKNGLRNAIEASHATDMSVVVTWGQSQVELWIAVLDSGNGLTISKSKALTPGTSTKQAHLGMGLAIAQQAVSSLGGALTLGPTSDGLTKFEIIAPRARV